MSGGGSGTLEIAARASPVPRSPRPVATTITFDDPTRNAVRRVLGIDADQMTVQASGPGGPLSTAQLGFQGVFNYCTSSTPRPSSCGGSQQTNVPTWNPATSTLVGTGTDTAGASGWFRPTAAITSITLTFSVLSGIPSFQLWASALISDISGTVELESGGPAPSGTTLRLLDADGAEVATTTVGAGGTYSFLEVVAAEYSRRVRQTIAGHHDDPPRRGLPATGGTGQGDILAFATITAVCSVAFYVVARRHSH